MQTVDVAHTYAAEKQTVHVHDLNPFLRCESRQEVLRKAGNRFACLRGLTSGLAPQAAGWFWINHIFRFLCIHRRMGVGASNPIDDATQQRINERIQEVLKIFSIEFSKVSESLSADMYLRGFCEHLPLQLRFLGAYVILMSL